MVPETPVDWQEIARIKLTNILGAERATALLAATLPRLKLTRLQSAEDLYRFGKELAGEGGLVEMAGSMLAIHAQLRLGSKRTF